MARLQLAGLRRAAVVFFSTKQVGEQIVKSGLLSEERLVHAPYGVGDEFFNPRDADLPQAARNVSYLLNVAGNSPRKRLDVLFKLFSRLHRDWPELRLIQHGAQLDEAQHELLRELQISERVLQTPPLSRAELAALYRNARLVVLTSDREGFGLPAVEALAAGAVVVVSDIPAFREVAGEAAVFCPPGEVERWADSVGSLLVGSASAPEALLRAERARGFSWKEHAAQVANAYARIGPST
jgi:glycosyltransferase involved in cell wall biosynthesis